MASVKQLVNRIREIEFPLLKHEFRIRRKLKGQIVAMLIAGICLLFAWVLISGIADIRDQGTNRLLFGGGSFALLMLICLQVPTHSGAAIAVERERHTFDLLALTSLPSSDIIVQKMLAVVAEPVVLVTAALPTMAVLGIRGGHSLLDIVTIYVVLVVTPVFVSAAGTFWSCMLRDARNATALTYLSMVCVCVAEMLLADSLSLVRWSHAGDPFAVMTIVATIGSLAILYKSITARRAGRKTLGGIDTMDAAMLSAGMIALLLLAMPLGTDMSLAREEAVAMWDPLMVLVNVASENLDTWAVLLSNVVFAAVGTAYLLHLSVRKLEALRCP